MRLYNPNFGKETEKQIKSRKRRENIVFVLQLFNFLAAIGGLVCCIVLKTKWYFYLVDIGGWFILFCIFSCFSPNKIQEYLDIPVEENEDQYIAKNLGDVSPEKLMTDVMKYSDDTSVFGGTPYKGIWRGIAVCECGEVYGPDDITYDVENRRSVRSVSENSDQSFYEVGDVTVKCDCHKCGKHYENKYSNVSRSTGSIKSKHTMFSDHTTITTTSKDADFGAYVVDRYGEDLKRHNADRAKYEKMVSQKIEELRRRYKYRHEAALRQIEKLTAEGWYEKPSGTKHKDQISRPSDSD